MGMRQLLQTFRRDQSGATAIEYGLIGSMIFVVVVGSIALLGNSNTGLWARVGDAIVPAIDAALGHGGGDSDGGDGD